MDKIDKIVFFDGECGLCNRVIDLLIRIDKSKTLHFASLQSPFAARFFAEKHLHIGTLDTIYFYHNQQLDHKSAAVKYVLLGLNGLWHFLGKLIGLVPKFIADNIYELVANNRFRLFGKTTCRMPSAEEKQRFLE